MHRLDQRAEIAVTGKQHHLIDMLGKLHGIDRKLDIHVALDLAPTADVDELLGRLGDNGIAIVVEPVDQGTNRRKLLIFDDSGVVEGAQQTAAALEFFKHALVIDVEAKRPGGRVEVRTIDKQRNLAEG